MAITRENNKYIPASAPSRRLCKYRPSPYAKSKSRPRRSRMIIKQQRNNIAAASQASFSMICAKTAKQTMQKPAPHLSCAVGACDLRQWRRDKRHHLQTGVTIAAIMKYTCIIGIHMRNIHIGIIGIANMSSNSA